MAQRNVNNPVSAQVESLLSQRKQMAPVRDFSANRLELCGTVREVEYLNDSAATTSAAVWESMRAVDRRIVWIAYCNNATGHNLELLNNMVRDKVVVIIGLGKAHESLFEHFMEDIRLYAHASSVEEAVSLAQTCAAPGDCVLFSPGTAAQPQFDNAHERGLEFRKCVNNLD